MDFSQFPGQQSDFKEFCPFCRTKPAELKAVGSSPYKINQKQELLGLGQLDPSPFLSRGCLLIRREGITNTCYAKKKALGEEWNG